MPVAKPAEKQEHNIPLPCAGRADFMGCEQCMQLCMNCRREVTASMTRVAGRNLRRLRAIPSCSVTKCAAFLRSVEDKQLRLHLSSMAWWRFSSDSKLEEAEPLRKIMVDCPPFMSEFGQEYMHKAIKVLSPLSQEQISSWFGCDNVYQLAALFIGDRQEFLGSHCSKCRLYKLGCTNHGSLSAESCPLWNDEFVQGVASVVAKKGVWKNPCRTTTNEEK